MYLVLTLRWCCDGIIDSAQLRHICLANWKIMQLGRYSMSLFCFSNAILFEYVIVSLG
jgi:hypothetical protein